MNNDGDFHEFGGLVGYLLLTKIKVFHCGVCEYILNRA